MCVSAEPRLHARRISLGGEGNALYLVLSVVIYVSLRCLSIATDYGTLNYASGA